MNREAAIRDLSAPLEEFGQLHADDVAPVRLPHGRPVLPQPAHPTSTTARTGPSPSWPPAPPSRTCATARSAGSPPPAGGSPACWPNSTTVPYTYRDVILTPGATAALNLALSTLFTPPDRIMLVTPCWMDYPLYLTNLRLGYDLVAQRRTQTPRPGGHRTGMDAAHPRTDHQPARQPHRRLLHPRRDHRAGRPAAPARRRPRPAATVDQRRNPP